MRSKLISVILILAALGVTVFMIHRLIRQKDPAETGIPETHETGEEAAREATDAYVVQCGYDLEKFIDRLAFGEDKNYVSAAEDLRARFESSKDYLTKKNDLAGATYCSAVVSFLDHLTNTAFSNNADFSSKALTELYALERSFPADRSDSLPRLPKLDTSSGGAVALAMFSVYNAQKAQKEDRITLSFGGNLVMGDTLLQGESETGYKARSEKSPYSYPLYALSSVLKNDDASFLSLKAPLTLSLSAASASSVKGQPAYAEALKKGGVEVVSVADNALLSYGEGGKTDTKNALSGAGVSYCDEGTVCYFETKIGTVAFLTYDLTEEVVSDNSPGYVEAPAADIRAARQKGAVIVITHFLWDVSEWPEANKKNEVNNGQVLTAQAAARNGADLVFSTHSSNLSALQQYTVQGRSTPVTIVYSAGDLLDLSSGGESFLFQQSFSLDENKKAVSGSITLLPLTRGEDGAPRFDFSVPGAETMADHLAAYSRSCAARALEYNNTVFTRKELNLIEIAK